MFRQNGRLFSPVFTQLPKSKYTSLLVHQWVAGDGKANPDKGLKKLAVAQAASKNVNAKSHLPGCCGGVANGDAGPRGESIRRIPRTGISSGLIFENLRRLFAKAESSFPLCHAEEFGLWEIARNFLDQPTRWRAWRPEY